MLDKQSMTIQEAATKIISAWEHGGRYDSHGNGKTYGLIGWEGDELSGLLHAFLASGGKLGFDPKKQISWTKLNQLADDPLMRCTQLQQAHLYMTRAILAQEKHFQFTTALGQLIICDIGVNSGLHNNYVAHCGADLAKDPESWVIAAVMKYRTKVLTDDGLLERYPGLKRRIDFYQGLLSMAVPIGAWGRPAPGIMSINGITVDLGQGDIEPLKL